MLTEEGHRRKTINAWCMYDWANSAFVTTVIAAVLPVYYSTVAGADLPGNRATVYWAYTTAIALLIIAVAAPLLGAIADHTGTKKRFLTLFAVLGALFSCLLALVGRGDWALASCLFVVANVGFAGANIFYDGLLPHVAGPEEINRISARGYALGYLGGGLLLALNLAWITKPSFFGMASKEVASRVSFLSVGLWWMLFSIPLWRRVREPSGTGPVEARRAAVRSGIQRLLRTLREVRRYRELAMFLAAFWLYNDGIGTIIKMAAIYGEEIGIGLNDLIGALLLVQFVGIPCSLLFGRLGSRIGAKRGVLLALVVYTLIALSAYWMSAAWHFWSLAIAVAVVQGGSQALSRSLFASMVPKHRSAEFFGFYSTSSKFAGIIGPLAFGLIGQLTGSSRLGIVSLVFFFVVGGWLLTRVDVEEGMRVAAAEG